MIVIVVSVETTITIEIICSIIADTLFSVRILSVLSVKSDVLRIFSIKIVSENVLYFALTEKNIYDIMTLI